MMSANKHGFAVVLLCIGVSVFIAGIQVPAARHYPLHMDSDGEEYLYSLLYFVGGLSLGAGAVTLTSKSH